MHTATRPDIAAALEFYPSMSNPSKNHWMGVKQFYNIFNNKGTLNYGLKYSVHGEETHLYGYSDADWAGDVDTHRSTSGYVFQFASLWHNQLVRQETTHGCQDLN